MTGLLSRRHVLEAGFAACSAVALGTLGSSLAVAVETAVPKVNEKDSMAVALGYVSDAARVDVKANPNFKAGASCSNCSWYQGKPGDAAGGVCSFFPGHAVDSSGWCRMWNKKQ